MKRLAIFIVFFLVVSHEFQAQNLHPEHVHHEIEDSLKKTCRIEKLNDILTEGVWGGHIRNYFMVTDHLGNYKTQYANAIGMKVHYTTARYRGFDVGLGGIFTFDAFSSDLSEIDARANRYPSFELQLFDVNDPENKYDLDRLEELFLRYKFGKSTIIFGRHEIITPLVNPADGRMKPYAFQGITFDFQELKSTNIFLSYITHVSPRSTVEWYDLGESIGVYNMGVNPKGDPGQYQHHIRSNGLAILGVDRSFGKSLHFSGTYYHVDNVFSTVHANLIYRKKLGEKTEWHLGMEGLLQSKLGNGGNDLDDFSYMCDQDENHAIGFTAGARYNSLDFSVSSLYVGDQGRFLFPREWGRENFFVTIPRGRIEGLGDARVYRFHAGKSFKHGLRAEVDYVYMDGPGTNAVSLNKYRLPNYNQINVDLAYEFDGWMKGTSVHLLYVYKEATEDVIPEVEYYQVNYNHLNLIMNIIF